MLVPGCFFFFPNCQAIGWRLQVREETAHSFCISFVHRKLFSFRNKGGLNFQSESLVLVTISDRCIHSGIRKHQPRSWSCFCNVSSYVSQSSLEYTVSPEHLRHSPQTVFLVRDFITWIFSLITIFFYPLCPVCSVTILNLLKCRFSCCYLCLQTAKSCYVGSEAKPVSYCCKHWINAQNETLTSLNRLQFEGTRQKENYLCGVEYRINCMDTQINCPTAHGDPLSRWILHVNLLNPWPTLYLLFHYAPHVTHVRGNKNWEDFT